MLGWRNSQLDEISNCLVVFCVFLCFVVRGLWKDDFLWFLSFFVIFGIFLGKLGSEKSDARSIGHHNKRIKNKTDVWTIGHYKKRVTSLRITALQSCLPRRMIYCNAPYYSYSINCWSYSYCKFFFSNSSKLFGSPIKPAFRPAIHPPPPGGCLNSPERWRSRSRSHTWRFVENCHAPRPRRGQATIPYDLLRYHCDCYGKVTINYFFWINVGHFFVFLFFKDTLVICF